MGRFQFIVSSGPEDPTRATRAIMFASRAVEEKHEVSVFLVDDAVYLHNLALARNVRAATGDTLMQYMQVLLDRGVEVKVCLPCAKARGVGQDALPPGWSLGKGVEAIRLDEQGYKTWVF